MKRPQPDIGDTLRESFIGNVSTVRKMMRLWGTTTVNGHEVFNHRRYYYPHGARPNNFEKLFKYLGAYEDVKDYTAEGVESAWLFLNKNQGTKRDPVDRSEAIKTFVSQNLNKMWWNILDGPLPDNLTLTATLIIESDNNQASKYPSATTVKDILSAGLSQSGLVSSVQANYNDLWLTGRITQRGIGIINKGSVTDPVTQVVTPDEDDLSHRDPWMSTITRYALRSQGVPCTIKSVSVGLASNREFDSRRIDNSLVVTIEIPYMEFSETTPVISSITSDLRANNFPPTSRTWNSKYYHPSSVPNSEVTQKSIKAMDKSDIASNPEYVTRHYTLWENAVDLDNPRYSSLWYNGYLKTAAFRSPRDYGFTFEELAAYLMTLVDSDYEEEDDDGSFFQKLIAVVIFVVVVVVTGGSAAAGGATFWGALAAGITAGALVLAIASIAFGAMGQAEWASAFASVNKAIEPLTMIASIYLLFAGATKQGLIDRIKKEGLAKVAKDLAVDFVNDIIDNLLKGAADAFSGKLTKLSVEFTSKLVDLVNMMERNKLEAIHDRNKDLLAEYEDLKEETSRESDALYGFMHIYPKPATADWSMYSSQFDMPYERGGGTLALGNVQKTTIQALRKGDYNDPAFYGIAGLA